MQTKKNVPKKGAGRKWAARLKEIGQQPPPKAIMEILNETDKSNKVAKPTEAPKDLDV
jgi:hypothetical protein